MSSSIPFILSILFFVVIVFTDGVHSSEGDVDPKFRACYQSCTPHCSNPPSSVPLEGKTLGPLGEYPYHSVSRLGVFECITGWSCEENCRYDCMRLHHADRVRGGLSVYKYYGKWPFIRVLGLQELFSVLFSIANFIPHFQYFFRYKKIVPHDYPLRFHWTAWSVASMNTWLWSAVFHGRDNIVTERLDYFCASFSIVFMICISTIRIGRIRETKRQLLIFSILIGLFLLHIGYLQFVHFDYGWNMTVSVAAGLIYSLIWIIYCSIQMHSRPYMKKMLVATALLPALALLEIFDFPPYFDLLDAHAIWHGCTPVVSYLIYSFLIDDADYEMKYVYASLSGYSKLK